MRAKADTCEVDTGDGQRRAMVGASVDCPLGRCHVGALEVCGEAGFRGCCRSGTSLGSLREVAGGMVGMRGSAWRLEMPHTGGSRTSAPDPPEDEHGVAVPLQVRAGPFPQSRFPSVFPR